MDYIHHYFSPLGGITITGDGEAVTGLWFDGQKTFAGNPDTDREEKTLPIFKQTDRWLDIYFSGREPDFTPALSMRASDFRKAVWTALLSIPYGETMTYGEIARRIALERGIGRMSAQAVGNAVAHNAVSLIIPCHRVLGANGNLTGYAGGLERKAWLLEMEKGKRGNDLSGACFRTLKF